MISALCTDLYQITMANAYFKEWGLKGVRQKRATFDLFVRSLPSDWKYLIACGVDEALEELTHLSFTADDIRFLKDTVPGLDQGFLNYLRNFHFHGNVLAAQEGMPIFPQEPILEVTGDIIEAQLVETMLLTIINYQTLIASKASRIVQAAGSIPVIDFGLRRAPGIEAGIRASRAAYIAGVESTSNVEAGRRYGIPVRGTHAHSYVMAHDSEMAAFVQWCRSTDEPTTLLIDTYDTERAAQMVVQAVKDLGCKVGAVRIDSGDLASRARAVRSIFDEAGLHAIRIFLSGDLNETKIADLRLRRTPVDGFGVGTEMVTARPESALGGVYKLVELDGRPKIKLSLGKTNWPGRKQVWRCPQPGGNGWFDEITCQDEFASVPPSQANMMLTLAVKDGVLLQEPASVHAVATRRSAELRRILPSAEREYMVDYPVQASSKLRQLHADARAALEATQ